MSICFQNAQMSSNTIFIFDGYQIIFRAYYANPRLTTENQTPIGAVYGFTSMLIKLMRQLLPKYAVIALDSGKRNFRNKLYPEYKSNRPAVPEDLLIQLPIIREVTKAFNLYTIESDEAEADDVIGTLVKNFSDKVDKIAIISSDKDLFQLVRDNIYVCDPVKLEYLTTEDIKNKIGVEPKFVRDFLALVGDRSDNIPGVPGIGPKTAIQLIEKFGHLDSIIKNLNDIPNARQRELIKNHQHLAKLSWSLLDLKIDLDLKVSLPQLIWQPNIESVNNLIQHFGFKSLLPRTAKLLDDNKNFHESIEAKNIEILEVSNDTQLLSLINLCEDAGMVSISTEQNEHTCSIKLFTSKKLFEIHNLQNASNQLLPIFFEKILQNESIKKIVYDLKSLMKFFYNVCNCTINGEVSYQDIMLMDYLLYTGKHSKTIEDIIAANHKENDQASPAILFYEAIYKDLEYRLWKEKLLYLYYEIELPLCNLLYSMEVVGIKIDTGVLNNLSDEIQDKVSSLEKQIFQICGESFNLGSPKQLSKVLSENLKLPLGKLSKKSNSYSTSYDVLERLSNDGVEVADLMLEWRQFTKLLTTYIHSLPSQVNNSTKRIHTTFFQTLTSTGRLSSQNPNLQNIPIRSSYGSKIRSAFVAPKGCKLLSADYSQIELRILSYVANIQTLKTAFIEGKDIHNITAHKIFKVSIDEVSPNQRRKAKAINFGIIYGISAFGLAKQLKISKSEASDYINYYFSEYPGIKKYMDDTRAFAHSNGYVQDIVGRKYYLPLIHSSNHINRAFAERAAINAPLQSTAAVIVKMAMVQISNLVCSKFPEVKIVLQIHDELLFQIPEQLISKVMPLIKENMEKIPCVPIPLVVKLSVGDNWGEMSLI